MIRNLTLWLAIAPNRFVRPDLDWSSINLGGFSEAFEWRRDDWGGFKDTVQPVEETLVAGEGDCEDYAVLVASYLLSETDKPIRIAFLRRGTSGHAVCYTDDTVYSSGERHAMSLRRYCAEQSYTVVLKRTLRE